MTQRQPLDLVEELFENEHVRLLFLFKVSLFGTWLTDTLSKTSPMGSVIRAFDLKTGYQLCQGGSFNLARGLMETFIAAGGRYPPQVAIDRILIEGGRATGITLTDGRTVRARQFVASTIDVHQTFENMIGRAQLPAAIRKPSSTDSNIRPGRSSACILLSTRARVSQPKPSTPISTARSNGVSARRPWQISRRLIAKCNRAACRQIVQFGSGPLSLLDPTQAPPGKHTTYAWHVMPLNPDTRRARL